MIAGLADKLRYEDGKLYWLVRPSNRVKVGDRAGSRHSKGYRSIYYKGKNYQEHQVVWFIHQGQESLQEMAGNE